MDSIVKKRSFKFSQTVREFLAETLGTFMLIMFGVGSVAQYALGAPSMHNFLAVNFGWGFGVLIGVYWSGGVSGGHINPAVSLGMCVAGRLPIKRLFIYWAGQTLGAFLASAVCFGVYNDLLKGDKSLNTAGIWTTFPSSGVSNATGFGDQLVATALLVGTIFALTDKRNNAPQGHILPVTIGFVVMAIGISFGANCGYGINPARDLIPRIFTAIAGWKSEPFKASGYWFWVPVIGQLCGGVLGALLYILGVEMHHPNEDETQEKSVVTPDDIATSPLL